MNRAQYRQIMQAARAEARQAAARLSKANAPIIRNRWFNLSGVDYSVTVTRFPGANRASSVTVKTSRLSQRPRRALAAEALHWAADYRNAARKWAFARPRNSAAARACVAEASAYSTVFNRLP